MFPNINRLCSSQVTIVDTGVRGMIAVGLVPQFYKLDHQPGWLPNSVAFHADDGKYVMVCLSHTYTMWSCSRHNLFLHFIYLISIDKSKAQRSNEKFNCLGVETGWGPEHQGDNFYPKGHKWNWHCCRGLNRLNLILPKTNLIILSMHQDNLIIIHKTWFPLASREDFETDWGSKPEPAMLRL